MRTTYHFHQCDTCGEEIGCSCPHPQRVDALCDTCNDWVEDNDYNEYQRAIDPRG